MNVKLTNDELQVLDQLSSQVVGDRYAESGFVLILLHLYAISFDNILFFFFFLFFVIQNEKFEQMKQNERN
jgi:hypothetical protein